MPVRAWLPAVLMWLACQAGDGGSDAPDDQGPPAAPSGALPVTLPVLPDPTGLPVVEGSIEGRPARLLIDTGAAATIVSASFLDAPPDRGLRLREMCLGSLCLRPQPVWVADTLFSRPEPDAINAIVGMQPLAMFVVELDHGRSITLTDTPRPCADGTAAITRDDEGRPYLPLVLDGEPIGPALLDTGALYTLLSGATAARLPYLAETATETGACSLDGCTTSGSFVSTARRLCAGSACLDQVQVKYPAFDAIGGSFLRQVRLVADFRGGVVGVCR